MSYQPEVGDRVTDENLEDEGTVLFVHAGQAVVVFDGDNDAGLYWFNELVKVKPRPKVREQSCAVGMDSYLQMGGPSNARIGAMTVTVLGQRGTITVAVVTDLDGEPLEVLT